MLAPSPTSADTIQQADGQGIKNIILIYTLKILTYVLSLLTVTRSYGQTGNCDTIYNIVETMPGYDKGLARYLMNDLIPVIGECIKRDSHIIASLYIALTIDTKGKVIDVDFLKPNLTRLCKAELREKLLTMNGWTPGQVNGQPVCSKFHWPISCIKWE